MTASVTTFERKLLTCPACHQPITGRMRVELEVRDELQAEYAAASDSVRSTLVAEASPQLTAMDVHHSCGGTP